MPSSLSHLRERLAAEPPGPDRARLAVEIAELEPVLGHRTAAVRAAIQQAGVALDGAPDAELEARVLIRLATTKMVEQDYEAADQALARAGEKVGKQGPLMYLCGARSCRLAIRRNDREAAETTLRAAASHLQAVDVASLAWRRVFAEITLGIAECAIHDEPGDPTPFDALRDMLSEVRDDAAWVDEVFVARQLLATDALARVDAASAANHLREVVRIAHEHGSPEDEIEGRLARAAALVGRGDEAGAQEAEKVVQIARDLALEHGLESLHVAALIAQAGLMDQRGKTAGALDRCLEIARSGVAAGNVRRYVAAVGLMATIYQRHNDFASAYRTVAESYHALRAATDTAQDVAPLFKPLLDSLRDQMGADRFAKMVDDVHRARQLADTLDAQRS